MNTLTEIGKFFKTDKATEHGFTDFYDKKLSSLRLQNLNVLEIGIWKGESLKMWKEYFLNSTIYGTDITDLTHLQEERIYIAQVDQTDVSKMNNVFDTVKFDIIIDDGGHSMLQQQLSLISLLHRLKRGGLYIVEDLHTSLSQHYFYNNDPTKRTSLELIRNFANKVEDFEGFHVKSEHIKAIYDQIQSVEIIETNNGTSITSILQKNN